MMDQSIAKTNGYYPDYEIDESDPQYALDKLEPGSPDAFRVYLKHFIMYQQWCRFWTPRLQLGKKCHSFMRRDIFTPAQRKKYLEVQDKWPIEPQEMKPIINKLTGAIMDRVKSGSVTMEDSNPPPHAASPDTVNVVLKWLSNQLKLEVKKEDALREGLIDGYPQWLWFDKKRGEEDIPGFPEATLLPWESTLCTPFFWESDGGDIVELMRVQKRSKGELLERFPDREDALKSYNDRIRNDPGFMSSTFPLLTLGMTAEDRQRIIFDIVTSAQVANQTGLYTTVEHFYSIRKNKEVQINPDTGDVLVLPGDWKKDQIRTWHQEHPEFSLSRMQKISTLWVTTWSINGMIWENNEHWFQKQPRDSQYAMLPGVPYIASLEDHMPTGVGEDMLPYILLVASCATEGLSQVRKGTGTVTHIPEGALKHPSRVEHEMSQEHGVIIWKKGHNPKEELATIQLTPNDTFLKLEDRYRDELGRVHNVNDAMLGQPVNRQSTQAKQLDISNGMQVQTPYIRNYTSFSLRSTQMLCYLMPYFLTEQQIIQIEDEFGNKQEPIAINVQEVNAEGTQAHTVLNDLTACDYRIIPTLNDDSATSRQGQMLDFVQILQAIGNSLLKMDPMMLGGFLSQWPNRYAQQAGKYMLQKASMQQQQQMQQMQLQAEAAKYKQDARLMVELAKIKTPSVNFKITPEDVTAAPEGYQMLMQWAQSQNFQIPQEPQMQIPQMPQNPQYQ